MQDVLPPDVDTRPLLHVITPSMLPCTLNTKARRADIPSSSNVPPLYFILFVSATYYLNRPCIYCSLLLTILVFCVYDFHNNWFEAQLPSTLSTDTPQASFAQEAAGQGPNGVIQNAVMESASIVASIANSTASGVVQSAVSAMKRKLSLEVQPPVQISVGEWLRELLGKKEWRIPCIDVSVRF